MKTSAPLMNTRYKTSVCKKSELQWDSDCEMERQETHNTSKLLKS